MSKLVLSVKREERNVGVLCMLGGYKSLGRGLARFNRLRVVVGAVRLLYILDLCVGTALGIKA